MQVKKSNPDASFVYALSFFIPVTILILIYILRGVYPFGNECFLRSDMYHQYAPFLAEFQNKLKTGGNLTYSWNIGMGVNFSALYAYYLATPINWIFLILPQSILIEMMSVILILKVGLSGVTFSYYICKRYNSAHPTVAGISVFYALSAYVCSYSWNVMWLDCIWLLPLILLGIECLVKDGKGLLYCISLALCVLSNYYIAIMVCMFCVLYFVLQMVCCKEAWKKWFDRCMRFGIFSLLAGGIGAALILPAYYALSLTVSGEFNFPEKLTRYFSVLEMISRQLMMVEPAIFSAHEPNIYCGMLIFILVPLYALNPNISLREKAGKFALIFFFYISFNLNILNYIWHGFHFPNSLPCRQSFIFNFLLLTMAYDGLRGIRQFTGKEIAQIVGVVTVLFLVIEQTFASDDYPYYVVYISLLFVGLYAIALCLYRNKRIPKLISLCVFYGVIILEAFINTEETSVNTTGRTGYVSDNAAISSLLEQAEDANEEGSFYRIEKLQRRTKNDSAWHHYNGVSIFSSTANAGFADFLAGLGCEESTNSYSYYGSTPLTEAMLSVKYVLSNELVKDTDTRKLFAEAGEEKDKVYLYENQYTLPIGFLIPEKLEETWSVTAKNPFSVQNNFADLAANVSPLFIPVDHKITGNAINIHPETDAHIYVYVTSDGEDFTAVYTSADGSELREPLTLNSVNNLYIMDLGFCPAGSSITFTATGKDKVNAYVYSLKQSNFEALYDTLSARALQVTEFKDTYIKGTITAEEDMRLFTSILYEKGWTVKIDGEEVSVTAFKDALVSVSVPKGTHEIEFSYCPEGLKPGLLITCICLGALIGIIVWTVKGKKRDSSEHIEVLSDEETPLVTKAEQTGPEADKTNP